VTTKVKIAIGLGVLLVAGVAYARSRKPLRCANGSVFKPCSKDSPIYKGGSSALRAMVDRYGGYCARQGTVEFAGESSVITQPSQVPDSGPDNDPDGGAITSPAQLGNSSNLVDL